MTRRIGVAISLLVTLLVVGLAIPTVVIYRNYQYDRLELALERDALILASDLSELPVDQWPAQMASYSSETGVRTTLVSRAGRVVVDSEGAAVGTPFNRPEITAGLRGEVVSLVRYSNSLGMDLRTVVVPIRDDVGIRGALRLSVPETQIESRVRALVVALVFVLLAVLVVAVGLSWLIARTLARPLNRLTAGALAVGEDPSARVGDVRGPKEIQAVATALDETAQKLDRMIERSEIVAAEASHQIRTPLAALRLQLENMAETLEPGQARKAQDAIQEVDRLTRRVEQVMALATSVDLARQERIDVGELAHQRVVDWQVLAAQRSIDLLCDYVHAPIMAPTGTVDRILDELVSNALTYAQSQVTVRVESVGTEVTLVVGDDGPGIPELDRERVFQRFERGENAVPGGTGLGLALVTQAVTASAGHLELVDDTQQTEFHIRWQRAAGVAAARD